MLSLLRPSLAPLRTPSVLSRIWPAAMVSPWRYLSSSSSSESDDANNGDGSGKGDDGNNSSNNNKGDETSGPPSVPPSSSSSRSSSSSSSSSVLVPPVAPEIYPEVMVLPITRQPLFPGHVKTVQLADSKVVSAISRLRKRGQPYLGVFLCTKDYDRDTIESLSNIHKVGTFATVMSMQEFDNRSGATLLLLPHRRIRATGIVQKEPYVTLSVENLKNEPYKKNSTIVKALSQEIISTAKDIAKLNQFFREQLAQSQYLLMNANLMDDPALLADFAASLTSAEAHELQEVLESLVIEERMRKALVLLKKELVNARVQYDIGKEVEERIARRQREHFLGEQLRLIKKELGIERDDKEELTRTFRARADKVNMPPAVRQVFDEELRKLSHIEGASAEFNVTRNYLDWLASLPWGIQTPQRLDIGHATAALDADHYGLPDVKQRILEFIAVSKLRGSVQGKILLLVGPPGVGKTSIGRSIANTLGRTFYRFSVGGLNDMVEIKGHRRTYVGAMPGKIVQCLKKTQAENPLVLIDEIDKIGQGRFGDPASALLEMLDPEQNSAFMDHYLDVPIDLSKVLFVCTANTTDTIPPPLLDRMEVIRLSGYVAAEKRAIADKYLIPNALKDAGLTSDQVEITGEAVDALIRSYCREAGVRNLQKSIEKILRKVALKRVKAVANPSEWTESAEQSISEEESTASADPNMTEAEKEQAKKEAAKAAAEAAQREAERLRTAPFDKILIGPNDLVEYLGNPVFVTERMYDVTPPGVIMGLAWTALGGTSLYIEAVPREMGDKGSLQITGQLGDVMKESSHIAMTYAKTFAHKYMPKNDFLSRAQIHLHVPEGATPKDGPSAGVTMTCALLSLAMGRPARADVAMTGEISLTGKVLRIGGVKEKTIAAQRSGVKHLILPTANMADWNILEPAIREGIEVHFVDHFEQLFPIVFETQPSALADSAANAPTPKDKSEKTDRDD